ncbi:hypothetical protein OTK50_11730 [Bacillus sp. NEAU-CP5]|uniref:hypothetical protein n=1 Tax=Bacillus TaxID=1386 RepID=UPI000B169AAF|nr:MULTISPECIES: hypothetical protein [Bacillus]MCX3305870.1 hypothetical protein [Bacillus velezensis]MCX8440470.1 hypothetical protein [Bacillus sp. NEAU-CP5]ULH20729.1 hypothetical protein MF598_03255 [Bacillus velezensis]WJF82148.1 hypothetical protein QRA13_15635 [Bacillus velezensis]WPF79639.1 hypothetical protein SCZ87_05280 [Bacillus velezensis]
MGKTRKTYDIHFKKKVVDLRLNDRMGYQTAEAVQEAVCKYILFFNHQRFQKK